MFKVKPASRINVNKKPSSSERYPKPNTKPFIAKQHKFQEENPDRPKSLFSRTGFKAFWHKLTLNPKINSFEDTVKRDSLKTAFGMFSKLPEQSFSDKRVISKGFELAEKLCQKNQVEEAHSIAYKLYTFNSSNSAVEKEYHKIRKVFEKHQRIKNSIRNHALSKT
ncbi:MAG: hypothetical protein ABH821_04735 [archaeon]